MTRRSCPSPLEGPSNHEPSGRARLRPSRISRLGRSLALPIPPQNGGVLSEVLGSPTEVDSSRWQVAGLEDEVDMVEEPPVKPPVDPGKLRDLVIGPLREEDPPHVA